jgi:hypothetical protein
VDSGATRLADYRIAEERCEENKQLLGVLQAEYDANLARHTGETTIVAMFTGKNYSGMEIWDCGRKQ